MAQPDVMAQMQVLETFQSLAPLLMDTSLKLAPNPKDSKRQRRGEAKEPEAAGVAGVQAQHTLPLLRLLMQLTIRHDQELSNLRKMDQFIFF